MLSENDESPASTSSLDTTKSYSIATSSTTTPSTTLSTTESTTKSTTTQRSTTTSSLSTTTALTSTALVTTKRYSLWKNSDDVPKTPKTYFSNSFYQNNNNKNQNNNINGPTYNKQVVTKRPSSDYENDSDISPSTKPATTPTINPFYYGFNRLPRYSTTSRYNSYTTTITQQQQQSPSTIKPSTLFSNNYSNNNKNSRTPYQFHHYYFTSTKKPDLLAHSTTYATNYEVDNNYHENDDNVETEKPKSSTYNPVFDIYFRQIARQKTAVPRIR